MRSILTFALALLLNTADDPRTVVREAVRAVEGDSVAQVRAQWQERRRRNAADQAATLGLASLARLTYDYPTAERLYQQLFQTADRLPHTRALASRRVWKHAAMGRRRWSSSHERVRPRA